MARPRNPLTAQIRALEALVKADKAEQRAIEAPIRASRRPLAESLRRALRSVDHHNQKLATLLYNHTFRWRCAPWPFELNPLEAALAEATANFRSRLVALQTFDALHNVEGAEYPRLPEVDREATVAKAKADYDKAMADIRARLARDRDRTNTDTGSGVFASMPDPETTT